MNAHQSVADFTAEEGAGFLQVSVQVSPGDQLATLLTGLGVQLTLSLVVDLCQRKVGLAYFRGLLKVLEEELSTYQGCP